ncbi:hypothetical protein NUSPORA_00731 [Nucleospora cyclopteri]
MVRFINCKCELDGTNDEEREKNNFFGNNGEAALKNTNNFELSLAPMLKVTTPCFRILMRKISEDVILFTEMIVSYTVENVSEDKLKWLLGQPEDQTVVQLGGSDSTSISNAVKRLVNLGFKHFNLNCGCPSDRVQKGTFGAILMKHKEIVSDIINRVYDDNKVVLSLKTRIGVDEQEGFEFLSSFVKHIVQNTRCRTFYIHARKCWLKGLNPKQNRNIPPLSYPTVYRLKEEFPDTFISLNGGLKASNIEKIGNCNGIMIGREAWNNLFVFNQIRNRKVDITKVVVDYLREAHSFNYSRSKILNPLQNIRKGKGNNKIFRKALNECIQGELTVEEVIEKLKLFLE